MPNFFYGRKPGISRHFELRSFKPQLAKPLPENLSYENIAPAAFDQGAYGFCVANTAAAIQMAYRHKREGLTDVISRSAIYSQAKYKYEPGDIQDDGLQITDGLLVLKNYGFVLESAYPYPTDSTGQDTGDALQPVPDSLWNPSFKEASYLTVDTASIESMMRAMSEHGPLVVGLDFPLGYENCGPDGYCNPNTAGKSAGGHCVWIVAFDQNRYGGAFKLRNSWGSNWGLSGDFWIPFNAQTICPQYWFDEAYCVSFS